MPPQADRRLPWSRPAGHRLRLARRKHDGDPRPLRELSAAGRRWLALVRHVIETLAALPSSSTGTRVGQPPGDSAINPHRVKTPVTISSGTQVCARPSRWRGDEPFRR
jgi:hypothetical protein